MAAGIAAGRYLPFSAGLWAVLAGGGIVFAIACLRREHLHAPAVGAVAGAVFCLSAVSGTTAYNSVPEDHIVTFTSDYPSPATVRGRVITTPQVNPAGLAYWLPPQTSFLLAASGIRRNDGQWLAAEGTVGVTVEEPVYELSPGQRVELVGTLRRVRPPRNPGQYDWQQADRYRGILARLNVPGADGISPAPQRDGALTGAWWRLRNLARRHLADSGEGDNAALLEALVLGERGPALVELNRAMADAGTAHMLSISGQHLGIFLGFVYLLCRVLAIPARRSATVVLVVLVAYVALTEMNVPLLRSAIMAGALCVAVMSGRSVSPANALAAAAIVLLVVDPLQLFQAGLQLSFGIVAGILLLYRPLRRLLFGRWLARRGLMVFRGRRRFRRWLYYRGANWGIGLVCLSLSAWIAAVPLVAHHFGLFNPYAPVLSVVLSPLLVMVLVPGYLSLALAWPMPNVSAGLGAAATAAAGWLHGASLALQRLPGLSADLFTVPGWLAGLFYVALLLWVLAGRRRTVLAAAAAATVALAVATVLTQRPARPAGQWDLHVLDVGHGSMALLHAPDGRTFLFDAGSLTCSDAYRQVLLPFLRQRRLRSPEAVFISHANIDHYSAVDGLAARHRPHAVYTNEFFARLRDDEIAPTDLLRLLGQRGVEVVRLRRGQVLRLGQVEVEVLWPPGQDQATPSDINDTSLVLRVRAGGHSVILPGDVGSPVETELVRLPEDVRGDVLLLPHHGSVTPTLKALVSAVNPSLLLQSDSRRDSRREQDLFDVAGHRPRYATYLHGWIGLSFGPDGITVQTHRHVPPAG